MNSQTVGTRALPGRTWGALVYLRTMLVFAAMWAFVAWWTENPILLPSPVTVLDAAIGLARDLELFEHAGISLGRMVISISIACMLAVPLGLAMGLSRRFDRIVDPTLEVLRPISGIAWIPLALFIFGIGNALPVFIMTYAAFFPILVGTVAAVRPSTGAWSMSLARWAFRREPLSPVSWFRPRCRACWWHCGWASRCRGPLSWPPS
jgi:ABC-type nitrate/sulfonate/bicarbonate transport system permease component